MTKLNEILSEAGISKVKLAKYLGVSRQMVYNCLDMDDINAWPLEKKMKLFNLLQIKTSDELDNISVNNELIKHINSILNDNNLGNAAEKGSISFNSLNYNDQAILNDIIFLLKDNLEDDDTPTTSIVCKYLYYFIQAIETNPEVKYILGYVAKTTGFINPNEFLFEKDAQFDFEAIMFSAMTLFNNGSSNKDRLIESHKRFVEKIQEKEEEKLSRTQELNTAKIQALKELGYTEINEENNTEILEKMAEILSRKI